MKIVVFALAGLALAASSGAQECNSGPPSRISDQYWIYLEACGCERADAPSRASSDYERYLKVCSEWRQRNQIRILVSPPPSPATPAGDGAHECNSGPPSRLSNQYWTYVEACGCEKADAPPRASSDYERYLKACSEWRQRNPIRVLVSPSPSPTPSPKPTPRDEPSA